MEPFDSIDKLITEHGSAAVLQIWNDKLRFETAQMEKRFSELEVKDRARDIELAAAHEQIRALQKQMEIKERLHRGILFKSGRHTGGQWQPFCPKCELPVYDVMAGGDRWAHCSAACGWMGVELDRDMAAVIAEIKT